MQIEISIKLKDNDNMVHQISYCHEYFCNNSLSTPKYKSHLTFILKQILRDRRVLKEFEQKCIDNMKNI